MSENATSRAELLAPAKAMIVEAPNWLPIRTFVEFAHSKAVGRWTSRKVRRALPWESYAERAFFRCCEVDPAVTSFLAQPHRLELNVGRSKPLIYFPDVRVQYADGTTEIVEIKRSEEELADPDYGEKLAGAASVYKALGWEFRIIIAEEEIDVDPLYSNAKRICADRHSLILRPAVVAIEEAFHAETQIALGEAEEIVARAAGIPLDHAVAILRAMVCTRRVAIEPTKRLRRDSPVTKPEQATAPAGRGRA
ncbi:TnsA endonuclease N-terminal domain-containing protein [Bradyrhizobium yuanmingense]|uniref:TnsA endonuclease N-terminal domain-containing protein n=1 Tax=Bradyrhizobium yuanmingense TaxID=108015 RepID=UPI0035117847